MRLEVASIDGTRGLVTLRTLDDQPREAVRELVDDDWIDHMPAGVDVQRADDDGGLTPPAPLSLDPVNDTGSGGTRGEDGGLPGGRRCGNCQFEMVGTCSLRGHLPMDPDNPACCEWSEWPPPPNGTADGTATADGGLTPPAPLSLDPVNDTGSGGMRGEDGDGTWTAILALEVCGEHELHMTQRIVTADFGELVVEGFLSEPPQWIILELDGTRYRISMAALFEQAIGELMLRRDEGLA